MALTHTGGRPKASPLLHLAPPEIEGGRIIVIGTGSLAGEAAKGCALPQGREMPPPAQCETLNLSEEEDSPSDKNDDIVREGIPCRLKMNEEERESQEASMKAKRF